MKIQSNVNGVDQTLPSSNVTRGESRGKPVVPGSDAGRDSDDVRIDPRASLLAAAETSLQEVPAVDLKRVEEIKQAITQGRFQIDSAKVADQLLGSARDLLMTRSA